MTQPANHDLGPLFAPTAVTIVGASEKTATAKFLIGNLLGDSGTAFPGPIHLINRSTPIIRGIQTVASSADVETAPGLVYLFVSPSQCVEVLEGFKTKPEAVVVYAGGAESGNSDAQAALANWADDNGIALLGPQSTGLISMGEGLIGLASPFRRNLRPGGIGLVMQSAGLLGGVLNGLATRDIGIRRAASIGNAAVLGLGEVGAAVLADPEVKALGIYVDAVDSSQVLFDLAKVAESEGKPIVMAVGGRSDAGKLAVLSHTGELATDRRVLEGLARQCGIILVEDSDELIWSLEAIAATGFVKPTEGGVAIYTSSGGGGIMLADVFDAMGVPLADISAPTVAALTADHPMVTCNPFDAGASSLGKSGNEVEALDILSQDPGLSVLVCALNVGLPYETGMETYSDMATMFAKTVSAAGKQPVVAASGSMGLKQDSALAHWDRVPQATGAKEAAVKVKSLLRWANAGVVAKTIAADSHESQPVSQSHDSQSAVISGVEAISALSALDVRWPREVKVASLDEASAAFDVVGFPVVLKAEAGLAHRAKNGGVVRGLADLDAARTGVAYLLARFPHGQVAVIEHVEHSAEYVIGLQRDARYGNLLMFGAGGSDVGDDIEFRGMPLSADEAVSLVSPYAQSTAAAKALTRAVLSFQQAVEQLPDVHSIDLNPVAVVDGEVVALDVKLHRSPRSSEETPR